MSEHSDSVWTVLSTCCVCGKTLTEDSVPQLLPCCHSSCKDCIEDNKNNLLDLIITNSTDKPEFKCKVCSQEYSPEECIDNCFQLVYWKQSKKNETNICQSCEGQNKSAVIKCQTCDWICDDCQTLHNTIKIFKGHELDPTTKTIPYEDMTKTMCAAHNEELIIYCKTCRWPYCARCILKDHNLHVYEDIRDENQMKIFYNNLHKKVESIKEKRSFVENALKMIETIETDITGQREQCITQIKKIVNKLQEKVSEFGTNLLDRVNNVCHKKEKDFNNKKNELRQLNTSFEFIERFMADILPPGPINEPMALMKAQDILNAQLERLLNRKCINPDFITPFKIEVFDVISEGHEDFDVGKMIDGVFNMCFKILSSDDPKGPDKTDTKTPNNTIDDEISIIGVSKPTTTTPRTPVVFSNVATNPAQNQTRVYVNSNQLLGSIIRGKPRMSTMLNNSPQQNSVYDSNNHYYNYNSNQIQNQMHSQSHPSLSTCLSAQPINCIYASNTQRFPNAMHFTQSMRQTMNSSESVPQIPNNFMPQTGLLINGQSAGHYANPAYRPQQMAIQNSVVPTNITTPVTNFNYISSVAANNQQNGQNSYGFAQNQSSLRLALAHSYNQPVSQSGAQTSSTSHLTVVYPTSTAIRPVRPKPIQQQRKSNTYSLQQQQQQQQQVVPTTTQAVRQQELQNKQREIDRIKEDLQSTSKPFLKDPLVNIQHIIENTTQTKTTTTGIQSSNSNKSNTSATRVVTAPEKSYELHISEDTVIIPLYEPQPERRPSKDSELQRQESALNSSLVLASVPNAVQINNCVESRPTPAPTLTPTTSSNTTIIATTSNSTISSTDTSNPTSLSTITSTPTPATITSSISKTIPTPTSNLTVVPENVEKTLETNEVVESNQNETSPTSSSDCSEEYILPVISSPPSNYSLFSELSNECNSPEIIETVDSNKDEEIRDTTCGVRPTAPIAVISPLNNEPENTMSETTDSNHNISEEISELSDEEDLDEDTDCMVCLKEYGEFICCAKCPRAFHVECHVPGFKKLPDYPLICTFCLPLIETSIQSLSSRKSVLNDRQQRVCEKVLIHLLCHKKSQHFKPPVCIELKQSLNLFTIKKKLEEKRFDSEMQFIDEIKRMFYNYKSRDLTAAMDVIEDYNTFEQYFKKIVNKFMPTFSEALQNNTSINNIDSSEGSSAKRSKSS